MTGFGPAAGQMGSPRGFGLDDSQRARLAVLERVTGPSDLQRGEVQALRIWAGEHDLARIAAVIARWNTPGMTAAQVSTIVERALDERLGNRGPS